jgi:GT2 family glycosyltransferase
MPEEPVTGACVAVVVPTWNGRRWIDRCLESLRATASPLPAIIVVDNGSRDGTAERVAACFPQVSLIRHRQNVGFAEGANVGIRAALHTGAGFVAVVNQDTWVERDWLGRLVAAAASDPAIGILTSAQYDYDGYALEPAYARLLAATNGDREFVDAPEVVGAVLLLRRAMLRRVGLFDPLYFAYFEEADLCRRARRAGFRVGLVPGSRVHHWHALRHPGEMSALGSYLAFRNQFVFELKDPGRPVRGNLLAWLALSVREVAYCLHHPRGVRRGLTRGAALAVSQASVLANLLRILVHRWREQRGAAYL